MNVEQTILNDDITDFGKIIAPIPAITNAILMKVEERDVYVNNLDEFAEAGACGTAAVISSLSLFLLSFSITFS